MTNATIPKIKMIPTAKITNGQRSVNHGFVHALTCSSVVVAAGIVTKEYIKLLVIHRAGDR